MSRGEKFQRITTPRKTVEIHLPDGSIITGLRNVPVGEFLNHLTEWKSSPIVAAVIDGNLRELTYPIYKDADVQPVTMSDSDGSKIYRRSLTFLLEAAFEELFPNNLLYIVYSVPNGGYFCNVQDRKPLNVDEISKLMNKMREIVKQDIQIVRRKVPVKDATEYFKKRNFVDKVRLLKYRKKPYLVLYSLGKNRDYHHGYMVPSTGFIKWFDLIPQHEGFILQYPRRSTPTQLFEMPQYSKLLAVFKQYNEWLSSLGIDSVGALNDSIERGKIRQVILVSEAQHEQKIAQIAQQIAHRTNEVRVILIAGPSSSGKTFFSKRLAIQLLALSIEPFAFELDNYFVDRDKTPKDKDGNYDFESIDAINRELLNKHIEGLIKGEEVHLLQYKFEKGKSELGEKVHLERNQLIILEGIHGLNPQLLQRIPPERTFKIYISCLTQLNLDRYNRISTTDTRMLRRIIRDATHRGYSAQRTIQMWESVRRGERNYIFPYQEFADEMFNSALVYELSVLKPHVEPLLRQIPHGTPEYLEAKRMLAILEWFLPIKDDIIPYNSILREFIGDSIMGDFRLWEGLTESDSTSEQENSSPLNLNAQSPH